MRKIFFHTDHGIASGTVDQWPNPNQFSTEFRKNHGKALGERMRLLEEFKLELNRKLIYRLLLRLLVGFA
jgi:hypothetical protein